MGCCGGAPSFRPVAQGHCPTSTDRRVATLEIGRVYELRVGGGDALVSQGDTSPESTDHRVRPDTPFRFRADSAKVSLRPATSAAVSFWFFVVEASCAR